MGDNYKRRHRAVGFISRILDRSGISHAGDNLSSAFEQIKVDSEFEPGEVLSFQEYADKFKLDDDALNKVQTTIYRRAIMYMIITAIIFISISYSIITGVDILFPLSFVPVVFLFGLYSTRMFFRAWQVRERRLASFDEFFHNPDAWF